MWACTWQALRPLARSAREPVDFRKRLIATLLRQARIWFGGGSRAQSTAELHEWAARVQAKEEEQLKQFQRHLNADSTQLDSKHIEESSSMPLYLQRPWKGMQAAAVELLSSLKAVRHPTDSVSTFQRAHSHVTQPEGISAVLGAGSHCCLRAERLRQDYAHPLPGGRAWTAPLAIRGSFLFGETAPSPHYVDAHQC